MQNVQVACKRQAIKFSLEFLLICHLHISICTKVMQNFGGQIRCVVRYVQVAYDSGNIDVCEVDKSPQ